MLETLRCDGATSGVRLAGERETNMLHEERLVCGVGAIDDHKGHHVFAIFVACATFIVVILFTSGAFGHQLGEYLLSASVRVFFHDCVHDIKIGPLNIFKRIG